MESVMQQDEEPSRSAMINSPAYVLANLGHYRILGLRPPRRTKNTSTDSWAFTAEWQYNGGLQPGMLEENHLHLYRKKASTITLHGEDNIRSAHAKL